MKKSFPQIDVHRTGQNIKWIMRKNGMTVRDIQKYLGLSAPQGIYHWFDGKSLPTIDNLYALSELFHMPMDEIVCGSRRERFYCYGFSQSRRLLAYYIKYLELEAG